MDLHRLTEAWSIVETLTAGALAPIENDGDHARALAALEPLWGAVGEDPAHPLANLARLLTERVAAYEDRAHPVPIATPHEMLAFLIEQRGETQLQLSAATGIDQGNVSRLLAGKRAFTADHARALGRHFGVSPAVFL